MPFRFANQAAWVAGVWLISEGMLTPMVGPAVAFPVEAVDVGGSEAIVGVVVGGDVVAVTGDVVAVTGTVVVVAARVTLFARASAAASAFDALKAFDDTAAAAAAR
jgi:hypothetical protein